MKQIELSEERRDALIGHLQALFSTEFDEMLSEFRAGEILDRMLKTLGPTVYNQAVEDVRAHFQTKLDDLNGEIYVD
ncbi:MAG: DUF2164 domain-containing protein, partial [Pseudomonadota bacterium]|nr:DUF2164 domain-containing protein [Pseudomonadota bacterium]